MVAVNRFFAVALTFAFLALVPSLQAHWHHRTVVENNVSVHVGGGYHHGWYHDRVYYTDPWYHPNHVYIYQGDPYAVYYYGYPYYYFDPRFYYFE